MKFLAFLLGWLPFVNLYRLEPIPSFWVQWAAFVLVTLLTALASWEWRRVEWRELTGVSFCILALPAFMLIQVHLGMVSSRVNVAFAVVILISGFLFHQVIRCQVPSDVRARLLRVWALGVACAGLCQAVIALLGTQGLTFILNELHTFNAPERMTGAFGQPNQFGVFLVLVLATLLYLVRVRWVHAFFFVPAWVLGAWMCAASGSRAALCVWLLLVLVHFFDTRSAREGPDWPRVSRGVGLWIMHALFLIVQVLWAARSSWMSQHVASGGGDVGQVLRTRSFGLRHEQYRDAWQLFFDRPFFGHGFEQFASARFYLLNNPMVEPQATHTHNLLTNALVEFGLIGCLAVLVGVVWVTWGAWEALRSSEPGSAESRLVLVWSLGLLGYSMLEFPFNYTQFLFAFLLVTAFLPAPGLRVSFRDWSILPIARWLILSGGLVMACLVAMDFHRVQALVLDLKHQVRTHGRVIAPPSLDTLTVLRAQSVFPNQVDYHWVMALGVDGDLSAQKIEVAKHLFERVPAGEQLAWYVVQLVSAGKGDEAVGIMCNYGERARYEYSLTVERLRALGERYPFLLEFLSSNEQRLASGCR